MHALLVFSNVNYPTIGKLKEAVRFRLSPLTLTETTFEKARTWPDKVDVVLACVHENSDRGLADVRQLRESVTGKLLVVGPVVDPKFILRVLQNGADHYLDENDVEGGLEAWLSRRHAPGEEGAEGRLLAILAVSGGCGASTIAVNLAADVAKRSGRCNLLDLNPGQGDLPSLLGLRPQFTWTDLCAHEARLDRTMYEKALVKHASGVHLLCSPANYDDVRSINPRGVGQAVAIARKLFADTIVDLQDCFHEEQVLVLRQATGILLISRLEFTSLRNARRILEHLDNFDIPRSRIKIVINQFGQPNELPLDEAENGLGEKLTYFVPYDAKTINAANNTGIPAVIKYPSAKVSQSFVQLAQVKFENGTPARTAAPGVAPFSHVKPQEGVSAWNGK